MIEKLKNNSGFTIKMNSDMGWKHEFAVHNEEEWNSLLQELTDTQNVIIEILKTKQETWLFEVTSGKTYSNYYLISGILQHDIYHLGQIRFLLSLIAT